MVESHHNMKNCIRIVLRLGRLRTTLIVDSWKDATHQQKVINHQYIQLCVGVNRCNTLFFLNLCHLVPYGSLYL